MLIPGAMLSPLWLVLVWAIFLPLLGWSALTVVWSDLRHSPVLNTLPAFSVGLLMLWYLKAGLHAGLEVHLFVDDDPNPRINAAERPVDYFLINNSDQSPCY